MSLVKFVKGDTTSNSSTYTRQGTGNIEFDSTTKKIYLDGVDYTGEVEDELLENSNNPVSSSALYEVITQNELTTAAALTEHEEAISDIEAKIPLVVNITESNDVVTCDTSIADIYAAYSAGREVSGRYNAQGQLNLTLCLSTIVTFSSIFGNTLVQFTGAVVNNTDTWTNDSVAVQTQLTFDSTPTANSTNPVTSGGIKTYVDTAINNLPEPMVFKGSLGTGGTITALPTNGSANVGDTYKVITAGTYANKSADEGDTFICLTKTSNSNTWELIPSGDEPSGTVTSVGMSVPTGLSVAGTPITSSGTLAVTFASGYSIPTTAKQGNWDTAYTNNHTHSNKTVLDGISSTDITNWNAAANTAKLNQTGSSNMSLPLLVAPSGTVDGDVSQLTFTPGLSYNPSTDILSFTNSATGAITFGTSNNAASIGATSYSGHATGTETSLAGATSSSDGATQIGFYDENNDEATTVHDALIALDDGKQDKLVSGTNIKTINSTSLLGSGNINVQKFVPYADYDEMVEDLSQPSGTIGCNTDDYSYYIFNGDDEIWVEISNRATDLSWFFENNVPETSATYNRLYNEAQNGKFFIVRKYPAVVKFENGMIYVEYTDLDHIFSQQIDSSGQISGGSVPIITSVKTINNTSLVGSGNIALQTPLVSGTNIKTINDQSLLGSGNLDLNPLIFVTFWQTDRPAVSSSGQYWYNPQSDTLQVYDGSAWTSVTLSQQKLYIRLTTNEIYRYDRAMIRMTLDPTSIVTT